MTYKGVRVQDAIGQSQVQPVHVLSLMSTARG